MAKSRSRQFKTLKDLFKAFDAVNTDEFKKKFLNANYLVEILAKFGFDKHELWLKQTHPNIQPQYHEERVDVDELPSR